MTLRWRIVFVCLCISVAVPQSRTPTTAEQMREAQKLLAAGSIPEAVARLRRLAETAPKDAQVHLLLGSALALVPLRTEAIRELTLAAELSPTAPVYHTLGTALARFGEYEPARKALEKAIELDPKLPDARVNLALLLAERGELSQAQTHVAAALALNPEPSRAGYLHYINGKLLSAMERWPEAAAELDRSVRLRPDQADGFYQLGLARRTTQEHDLAVRALTRAVELEPGNPRAQYYLGLEYIEAGQPERAIGPLKEARRLMPGDRGAIQNLARAYRQAGRKAEADALTAELAQLIRSRKTAEELQSVGRLNTEAVELEKAGNGAAALDKYREALRINPDDDVVRRNLALLLCRMGRWDEGIRELRSLLELNPDDAETRKILYLALDQAAQSRKSTGVPKP